MKKITLLFTFLSISFGFSQNGGVDCASAVSVSTGTITGTTITDTNAGADENDFAWFSFTAPGDGTMILSSCDGGDDTHVIVYDDCAGAALVENDDACDLGDGNAWASYLEYPVANGTTYYIQWTDRWSFGPFDWEISFIGCIPPAGTVAVVDDCANSQFTIDVDVTDLGSNGALSITNNFNADVVAVDMGVNTYSVGPFPTGSAVSVSIVGDNADCDISSGVLTDSCPPSNDECGSAIAIACDGNYAGSTVLATDSGGNGANDVWFSYTGSGVAEDVTLDLCGSGYDTAVRVFTDCPATNQIAFNDDNAAACGAGSTRSYLTFASDGTSTYYIMVEGWNTSQGTFVMNVTCAANIPAPANDLCANAEGLTLDVQASGTTAGATDSSTGATDDTTCQPFQFKSDVWYSFVAPADGDVGIMTTITGASDQANIAVYPDCNQLDDDSLGCSNGNGGEMLNVTGLTSGATYYVMVWSDGIAARQGNFRTEGTFNIIVMDATLSTEDFQAVNQELFTYFPNPVSNNLTIKAQKNIQNITVFNMLGQTVINNVPNAVESNVDMSALKSGAYFVKVTVDNQTETIRIIRN
ncbi:hypothetical protein C1T31_11085 [Hanstruepera neustonica]|uniref:Uncharacterized protein n=1 Tax=Hanstruepera neustonica TaxID=1445657 RepID=A0A2K1DXE1_9FLAO|nr:T9SS type A sorting domain-containing protein [Hanstruepera neustonica]PNQ72679.1 hypothetical protein C1T31_11085 [Hanstruepera neustonica]